QGRVCWFLPVNEALELAETAMTGLWHRTLDMALYPCGFSEPVNSASPAMSGVRPLTCPRSTHCSAPLARRRMSSGDRTNAPLLCDLLGRAAASGGDLERLAASVTASS